MLFRRSFQGSGVLTEYVGIAIDNQLTREPVVYEALEAGNPSPHFMNIRVSNVFCRLDCYMILRSRKDRLFVPLRIAADDQKL